MSLDDLSPISPVRTVAAHGVVQGGATEAMGGDFRHGFYAGVASAALAPQIEGISNNRIVQTAAAAVVGGTASALGGGKFANGAVSGAFTYLFNWASHKGMEIHQAANMDALHDRLASDEIAILNSATAYADAPANQDVTLQYKHAMTDLDHGQTVDQAKVLANAYVRERFETAWKLMDEHDTQGALFVFGQGLHTLQDATSPSHYGFQGWHNSYNSYTSANGISHVGHEMRYPGSNSALYRTTKQAYSWFADRKLPDGDLFNGLGHD